MRDATRIKRLADTTIQLIEESKEGQLERDHLVLANLNEISRLAQIMDARTGKHDPSSIDE